jgi:hypothetical protein
MFNDKQLGSIDLFNFLNMVQVQFKRLHVKVSSKSHQLTNTHNL